MSTPTITDDMVEAQAVDAAHHYTSVNDACPYNFYSHQGQVFKKAFQRERVAITLRAHDIHKAPQK